MVYIGRFCYQAAIFKKLLRITLELIKYVYNNECVIIIYMGYTRIKTKLFLWQPDSPFTIEITAGNEMKRDITSTEFKLVSWPDPLQNTTPDKRVRFPEDKFLEMPIVTSELHC